MATRYVVLRRSSAKLFAFVSVQEANGPAQAVRLATEGQVLSDDSEGELYVCVPERNWSIVPVSVIQREPQLHISEGDATLFLRELANADATGERAERNVTAAPETTERPDPVRPDPDEED